MIDIEQIRDNLELVSKNLARRGVDVRTITELAHLDTTWRTLTGEVEQLRSKQNQMNKEISQASSDKREEFIKDMKEVSTLLKSKGEELADIFHKREVAWRLLPNLVAEDVPDGDEGDFEIIDEHAGSPSDDASVDYLSLLGEDIDLERAANVSGSRFVYIKGQLARLEQGLVSFIFDKLAAHTFTPVFPPVLISEQAMAGMGYLDHEGDEVYKTQDDLYLIGTSEQAIGPMHMNEILEERILPLRYVAFSSCFRREAGSHGKDVKGILRLHQFEKVEMFSFSHPDKSEEEHELLLQMQREIMDALEVPYRVVKLAAQDLGSPSAKTFDIESWIPSEDTYRETHSTSNTTDFQARRLNIRFRSDDGTRHVHMLNGTAVAMSRILIALIENHQQTDGSIAIPTALHSYVPFTSIQGGKARQGT